MYTLAYANPNCCSHWSATELKLSPHRAFGASNDFLGFSFYHSRARFGVMIPMFLFISLQESSTKTSSLDFAVSEVTTLHTYVARRIWYHHKLRHSRINALLKWYVTSYFCISHVSSSYSFFPSWFECFPLFSWEFSLVYIEVYCCLWLELDFPFSLYFYWEKKHNGTH